jgi:hypothetical protein
MIGARITVSVGNRTVSIDALRDARLASALESAGRDVARRLEALRCPVHRSVATNVRIHFDERGGADLQYDSCCERLAKRIREALS